MLRAAPPPPVRAGAIVVRLLLGLAVLTAVLMLTGIGTVYGAYSQLALSLKPRLEAVAKHDSFQTTRIYDRNNTLLYEFVGTGRRTRVPLEQISTRLISATVAIEDKTFFENQGVDYEGILKAFYRSLQAGEETGGASTITQQLVRGVILTSEELTRENRYRRKLTEIILAQELSRQYTKKEILELYLNEIYYGNLAYGIEAASDVYFDVHAKDLSLAQAALLAGLPQLPNVYDPVNYLEGGTLHGIQLGEGWLNPDYKFPVGTPPPKIRQASVLTQMVDEGYVTERQARARAVARDPGPDRRRVVPRLTSIFVPHTIATFPKEASR
jgi:peptidoglycan glycosyltransferase